MIRVLHILSSLDIGGIENFIMSSYRQIDRKKIQYDFIVHTEEEGFFEKEILSLGGRIYRVTRKKDNLVKNFLEIKKIVKNNNYKIIHRHGSNSQMVFDLIASKLGGAIKLIAHSHSIRATGSSFSHQLFNSILPKISDVRLACSRAAGEHLFKNNEFQIIENGITVSNFAFDCKSRLDIRRELNLQSETVLLGHIGRLVPEKNHVFLLKIFNEFQINTPNSVLLLIGEGPERGKIENLIKELNLESKVMLTGEKSNVKSYLDAMDIFILPSIAEGLGIVTIEAQANGLNCIASNNVPEEIAITELVKFVDLDKDLKIWSDKISNSINTNNDRLTYNDTVSKSKYNILSVNKKLAEIYLESGR